jgi:hypothetical protein
MGLPYRVMVWAACDLLLSGGVVRAQGSDQATALERLDQLPALLPEDIGDSAARRATSKFIRRQLQDQRREEIRAAVLADIGSAHAPGWLFAREIAANTVLPVLRDYEPTPLSISAVHPGVELGVRGRVGVLLEVCRARRHVGAPRQGTHGAR